MAHGINPDSSRLVLQPSPRTVNDKDVTDIVKEIKTTMNNAPLNYNYDGWYHVVLSITLIALGAFACGTGAGLGLGLALICLGLFVGFGSGGYRFWKASGVDGIVTSAIERKAAAAFVEADERNRAAIRDQQEQQRRSGAIPLDVIRSSAPREEDLHF